MERLRVATLNIWNRCGPWPERLALIRRELSELAVDVLGLQEVLRLVPEGVAADGVWRAPATEGEVIDQASAIAAGSGCHIAYGTAQDLGGGLSFGNALLSRHPIVEHRVLALPGEESGEQRSLLYAVVRHPRGTLPVFVTHLNWKLHHGSVRLRQVRFIADRVAELAPTGRDLLPPVLVGDFNAEPDSDEVRFLKGLATVDGRSVFFADAWLYGGDGTPGYTYDPKNPYAALSHEPPRRIDYVFVRGPDRRYRGEPLAARLAFDRPDVSPKAQREVWPSDHFGVVAELALTPREPYRP